MSRDAISSFEKKKYLPDICYFTIQLNFGEIQIFVDSSLLPLHDSDS